MNTYKTILIIAFLATVTLQEDADFVPQVLSQENFDFLKDVVIK